MLVSGVRGDPFAGRDFKHRDPYGYEKTRVVAFANLLVHAFKSFRRAFAVLEAGFDQNASHHHEQGSRYTLSGYVRHDKGDVIRADHKEIIEISAYLLRRRHAGKEAEFPSVRKSREQPGQLAGLDFAGHIELCTNPLFFGSDMPDLVYVQHVEGRLFGEGFRQNLDLVSGSVDILHLELPVTDAKRGHPPGDGIQRIDDPPCDGECGNHTDSHDEHHKKHKNVSGMEHFIVKSGDGAAPNLLIPIPHAVVDIHLLLFFVGVVDQQLYLSGLVKENCRISCNDQNNCNQQHTEYFLPNTARQNFSFIHHRCFPVEICVYHCFDESIVQKTGRKYKGGSIARHRRENRRAIRSVSVCCIGNIIRSVFLKQVEYAPSVFPPFQISIQSGDVTCIHRSSP